MAGFVQNVLRPGSREFVIALNCVLALLFSVMLAVVYTELDNSIHAFVMLFIVVGLTVSINVFIAEANRLKDIPAGFDGGAAAAADAQKTRDRAKTD
jgi:hypothetical protein